MTNIMLKKSIRLALIALLICYLPANPADARSSSSSTSSTSSSSVSRSAPSSSSSNTSYSRSSSSSGQTKPTTSSSSTNSSSTFGSSYNSSYSSRPVDVKPVQATTTTKPSVTTTYLPEYKLPNTSGRTETRYVTIFSETGNRTVPVIVPFGYSQPVILPSTYYPQTTVVNTEPSVFGTIVGIIVFSFIFFVFLGIITRW